MNPFMMQMFMNPMGMGCMPMNPFMGMNMFMPSCCCMSMPYYQNDNLPFLNYPIYRDTSYDYLLDPMLAIRNAQQQWAAGGGGYGSTMLPGLTFPQITMPGMPGLPGIQPTQQVQPQKTPEQQEAEKKKAEEDAKPEAKQAKSLNEFFDKINQLAKDSKNGLPEIPEELVEQAKEAMEEETAEEQLEAMQDVFESIPEDAIRKTILADNNIKAQLRKAGYNFNSNHTVPNSDIKDNDIDNVSRLTKLHSDIIEKNYNELQVITGLLTDSNEAKSKILGVISSWNDKYKNEEKGIIRFIGNNLPTGDDAIGKSDMVKNCTKLFVQALLIKADEFDGYEKIAQARKSVSDKLDVILADGGFKQDNLNSLADACDTLYARLRMQEALKVRNVILRNSDYTMLNEIKPGVLDENIIIQETVEDLKAEGFAENVIPTIENLDAEPEAAKIAVKKKTDSNISDDAQADEAYADDVQALVDEYLVKEKKYLTKVSEDSDVYKSVALRKNGKFERYFMVDEGKLIEVTKKSDGTGYEKAKEPVAVSAVDIGTYNASIIRAKNLMKNGSIIEVSVPNFNSYPIFKSTGKINGKFQYFAIIDGKFGKIRPGEADGKVNLTKLTIDNIDTEYKDENIKSKKKEVEENKEKVKTENQKRADEITKDQHVFRSINDTYLSKIGLASTGVTGYYKTKTEPTLYFRYNDNSTDTENYKHLTYLKDVKSVKPDGTILLNDGNKGLCREVQTSEECAKELEPILANLSLRNEEYIKANKKQCDEFSNLIKRKLNNFSTYEQIEDIVNFIKAYNDKAYHLLRSNDTPLCVALAQTKLLTDDEKKHYIKVMANSIKQVIEAKNITLDENGDDKLILEHISEGKLVEYSSNSAIGITVISTANELQRIIDKFLIEYDKLK